MKPCMDCRADIPDFAIRCQACARTAPRAAATHPCLDCSTPTPVASPRCPDCEAAHPVAHNFGSRHNKAYDTHQWRAFSKRKIAAHVRRHGWNCPGFGVRPHPATDLTCNHKVRLADGGPALPDRDGADVYCNACNIRASNAATKAKRMAAIA